MKVTMNIDGSVDFDVDTLEEVLAVIHKIQRNGTTPKESVTATTRTRTNKTVARKTSGVPVPRAKILTTLQYLVDHGSPSGMTLTEIASGMRLKRPAVKYRIDRLVEAGLVEQVRPAYFAPKKASEG